MNEGTTRESRLAGTLSFTPEAWVADPQGAQHEAGASARPRPPTAGWSSVFGDFMNLKT